MSNVFAKPYANMARGSCDLKRHMARYILMVVLRINTVAADHAFGILEYGQFARQILCDFAERELRFISEVGLPGSQFTTAKLATDRAFDEVACG